MMDIIAKPILLSALMNETVVGLLALLLMIPSTWISLAIQVKRWHDRDKSGWWALINIVPVIGGLWALVECGFLKGDEGANRFGAPVI